MTQLEELAQKFSHIAKSLGYDKTPSLEFKQGTSFLDPWITFFTHQRDVIIFSGDQNYTDQGLYELLFIPNYLWGNVDSIQNEGLSHSILNVERQRDETKNTIAYRVLVDESGNAKHYEAWEMKEYIPRAFAEGYPLGSSTTFTRIKAPWEYLGIGSHSLLKQIKNIPEEGFPEIPEIVQEKEKVTLKDYAVAFLKTMGVVLGTAAVLRAGHYISNKPKN